VALLVNGHRVEWAGYEFGLRFEDGAIEVHPTLASAQRSQRALRGAGMVSEIVFRTKYVDGWEPTK
jgi:hypothetical protein